MLPSTVQNTAITASERELTDLEQALADAVIAAVDGIGVRATHEPESWPPARHQATAPRDAGHDAHGR